MRTHASGGSRSCATLAVTFFFTAMNKAYGQHDEVVPSWNSVGWTIVFFYSVACTLVLTAYGVRVISLWTWSLLQGVRQHNRIADRSLQVHNHRTPPEADTDHHPKVQRRSRRTAASRGSIADAVRSDEPQQSQHACFQDSGHRVLVTKQGACFHSTTKCAGLGNAEKTFYSPWCPACLDGYVTRGQLLYDLGHFTHVHGQRPCAPPKGTQPRNNFTTSSCTQALCHLCAVAQ